MLGVTGSTPSIGEDCTIKLKQLLVSLKFQLGKVDSNTCELVTMGSQTHKKKDVISIVGKCAKLPIFSETVSEKPPLSSHKAACMKHNNKI